MENDYLSVVSSESIVSVLAIALLICLFIGITDFVKNMSKMGE